MLARLLPVFLAAVPSAQFGGVNPGGPPTPPAAVRVHYPGPLDVEMAGGFAQSLGPGDMTPDGRILVFYRPTCEDEGSPECTNPPVAGQGRRNKSLFAAAIDPAHMTEVDGHLTAFSNMGVTALQDEPYKIEDGINPCDYPDPNFPPDPADHGGFLEHPLGRANSLTLALRQLNVNAPHGGQNPYPSNAGGVYNANGTHLTYRLHMVKTHFPWVWSTTDNGECSFTGHWKYDKNSDASWLGLRKLDLVLDTQTNEVVNHQIFDFEPLMTTGDEKILGTEPTITADGRLLLFHGPGDENVHQQPNAVPKVLWGMVTFTYRTSDLDDLGWQPPRTICSMYPELGPPNQVDVNPGGDPVWFYERYPLARHPITEPDGTTYGVADDLRGPYPWVSKDGSFFLGSHVYAELGGANPNAQASRAGNFACGEITQGYVKHIDDAGINPTRQGNSMNLPPTGANRSTNRHVFTSTGLEPSLWQPHVGRRVPVPSHVASLRIPILPVWVFQTQLYGEVRFEEADGNYLLYLACNEGFTRRSVTYNTWDPDPTVTPDTSGRVPRCDADLAGGAGFPHQFAPGGVDEVQTLVGANGAFNHQNVGYKGQAIAFPGPGRIDVSGLEDYAGQEDLTVQLWVKALNNWSATNRTLIEQPGRFKLHVTPGGSLHATVWHEDAVSGTPQTRLVSAFEPWITTAADMYAPEDDWRHVALTVDGSNDNGDTVIRIWVDGVSRKRQVFTGTSVFSTVASPGTLTVGPNGTGGAGTPIFLLDEVALSDVARTGAELKRDAYVAPAEAFVHEWPEGAPVLPLGLLEEDVSWPAGLDYNEKIAELGHDLFHTTDLSGTSAINLPPRSCATCHIPGEAFTENLDRAVDFQTGLPLPFNTPTLMNMAFGQRKFFDGRAADLEEQALEPIASPAEMHLPIAQALSFLSSNTAWSERFEDPEAFGEAPNEENLGVALAMFQRTILSGDSDFDKKLLTHSERKGKALFFGRARCFGCHSGSNFSDDDFHNVGSVPAGGPVSGRGGVTGRDSELGMVKAPTLRELTHTAPYFHDGSKTLLEVIQHYNRGGKPASGPPNHLGELDRHLLPLLLTPSEELDLLAFLQSLSNTPGTLGQGSIP